MPGLRIAMLGQRGVPATFGGVERHVEEIGARLVERGHEVTVYCRANYSQGQPAEHRGMRLAYHRPIATKHLEAITQSGLAALSTVRHPYDIVHVHALGPAVFTPLPRFLSRAKVVQTIHGFDQDRNKWSRAAQLMLRAGGWMSAHVPDATIVVSKALQDGYLERYGTVTHHIPNGSPSPRHLPPKWITSELGLEPGRYVLFVGRLVPEKAPDLLAEAYRLVDRDLPLVIAGGSSFTDDYVAQLKALASRDRRIRMPGYVFGDALHELYSHAAVFVLPSLLEGLPLTLLEALAYDRSVVASSIPPHVEVLKTSGPARRLVPPGELEPLARAITEAIDRAPEEIPAAQELGRWVRRRYSWDAATDATEAIYLELAERGRRATRTTVPVAPGASADGTGVEPVADEPADEAVTSAA